METLPKNENFDKIFNKRLKLDPTVIIRIAKELGLTIRESDIPQDIKFLKNFRTEYPLDTTTSEQFSMLMIFFTIRRNQELKEKDKTHMGHLKNIQMSLRKSGKQLVVEQIDFWKWFILRL